MTSDANEPTFDGDKVTMIPDVKEAWDAFAKARCISLSKMLGGVRERIDVGVSIGIQPTPDDLLRKVAGYLTEGYRRIKIKIAPGSDIAYVRAVRREHPGILFQVDANSAYALSDIDIFRAMDNENLLLIEQPLSHDDIFDHSKLQRQLKTPICLDETLHDAGWARQVAEIRGPKVWNLKVHRVGGLTEAIAVYREAIRYGAALWAGTVPESGIGSQADLEVAALPGFVYPSDLEPSTRWYGRNVDVIKLVMGRDGTMQVPGLSVARMLDAGRFRAAARRLL